MLLHTKRQDFKILVFCNMRCETLLLPQPSLCFIFTEVEMAEE